MSSWDQANRGKNLVWFGEIEGKLAKLRMTIPLLTVLPLNYFMVKTKRILDLCLEELSHVIYYYMVTSEVIAGGFIPVLCKILTDFRFMPGGAVACDLLLPVHICGHSWRIYPAAAPLLPSLHQCQKAAQVRGKVVIN